MAWYSTPDGWKRTELGNEEMPHWFPSAHEVPYTERFLFPPQGDTRDPDSLMSS
jgi:hypothetical protein